METWVLPAYLFTDGEWVECKSESANPESDRWERVYIKWRSLVFDFGMRQVPVYMVEDRRGTTWIAGEGELRREE